MKLRKIFIVPFLLCAINCAATNVRAKEEWIKTRSQNFTLVGNAAETDIENAAIRLEQFRLFFRRLFPKADFNSPIPINVIVFKDEKSFRDYKAINGESEPREWVKGFFQKGADVNYIALSVEGAKENLYRTIFHEYVHYLIDNELGRAAVPPWLNEGLAEYYETFQIQTERTAIIGEVNEPNLNFLRQNQLIPLDTFFNTDNYTLQRQGRDGAGLFYAQAWALMHFLKHGDNAARSGQLSKFTDLILSGKSSKDAFIEAFQTDYATMEGDLKSYIQQKNFRSEITTLAEDSVYAREPQSAPISETEAKTFLGDLLFHTNRLSEASLMLEDVLKIEPDSSRANAALGLTRWRQGRIAEAEKYLAKAVALDDKNYLAHFLYAYVVSRDGMTDYGFVSGYTIDQIVKMRNSLERAIELNPKYAESYQLLAFIDIVRNEKLDEARKLIDKALEIAPGNQWYQMRLAEIYARKENFSEARRLAQKIYDTSPDDALRLYAKATVYNINSYEAQLESIKKNRRAESDVTDQPLTEEEMRILNEKALREAINFNLRRPRFGEKRILGYLSKIECEANGIEYFVKTDNQNLLFKSPNFDSIKLTAYVAEMINGQIGCGTIEKDAFAAIIYRPTAKPDAKSAGEIVSIEFVPKNFKFLE